MDEVCPHLGVVGDEHRLLAPVEFPSFENQCLALNSGELILLGDQATYCLSREHRTCPRFRRAHADDLTGDGVGFVPFHTLAEESWSQPLLTGPDESAFEPLLGREDEQSDTAGRRRWAWIGGVLVFTSVFLCGSMVAGYTGWQWIARNLPQRNANGRVETVSAVGAQPSPAVFIIQTATPEPGAQPGVTSSAPTAQVIVMPPEGDSIASAQQFPAAVTPTPIVVEMPPLAGAVNGEGATEPAADAPSINVDIPIPTRRPTPVFDLPTSTPLAAALPQPTATATPAPLGTPVVLFAPDKATLEEGDCTVVRWNVLNVREVYYENLPMSGQGEREECIDDESELYTLLVVLGDGSSRVYTTTVTYLAPTVTPTVTPSFTPEPEHTPTWTPIPPTATPVLAYGVALSLSGSADLACGAGQSCETGLLVTNSGDGVDTIVVTIAQGGAFAVQLCRPDGVCAGNDLSISNVGPGNTAYLVLRVAVPADAGAQSTRYGLVASSAGSGRTIQSQQVDVTVTVP